MDELPRDAKAFLNLTRDVHDPPDRLAARERVHTKLMAAIAVAPAAAALAPGKAAGRSFSAWFASSKIMVATTMLALTSGGLWAYSAQRASEQSVQRASEHSAAAPVAVAGPVEVAPAAAPPPATTAAPRVESLAPSAAPGVVAEPAEPSFARAAPRPHAVRGRVHSAEAVPSLSEETLLLARASAQLSRNEVGAALQSIEQHRQRFGATSQLSQERDGLVALAHCLRDQSSARGEARGYIARAPSSVLVTRLEQACGL